MRRIRDGMLGEEQPRDAPVSTCQRRQAHPGVDALTGEGRHEEANSVRLSMLIEEQLSIGSIGKELLGSAVASVRDTSPINLPVATPKPSGSASHCFVHPPPAGCMKQPRKPQSLDWPRCHLFHVARAISAHLASRSG